MEANIYRTRKRLDGNFVSWGEVTAAARTTGMTEKRNGNNGHDVTEQLRLLESKIPLKS